MAAPINTVWFGSGSAIDELGDGHTVNTEASALNPAVEPVRVAERLLRYGILLCAILAPLSEGGFQIAVLLAVLLAIVVRGRTLFRLDRLGLSVAVLLASWATLGVTVSLATGSPVRTASLNYALMSYGALLGLELAYFSDRTGLRSIAAAFALGLSLAAAVGLCQWLFGTFPGESLLNDGRSWRGQLYIPGTRELAATGTLQHRLKMSEMWLAAIAVVAGARAQGFSPVRAGLSMAVCLVFLALTYTKAALGAGALAAILTIIVMRREKTAGWILTVVLGALIGILPAALHWGLLTTPELPVPRGSLAVRPWLWSYAADFFFQHPVFGHGLGTYHGVVGPRVISGNDTHMWGAHQQLLTIAVETGTVGLVLFALGMAGVGRAVATGLTQAPSADARALLCYAFTLFVALAITAAVHDVLYNPGTALLFWIACGIALGVHRKSRQAQAASF